MIQAEHVQFEYFRRDEDGNVTELVEAVKDVSLHIKEGEFVAILGQNGSGKSTFAKMVNALLTPSEGSLIIAGMESSDEEQIWNIRKSAGMVFQNPDNQIVGTVVEEDVAFGPENIGIPEEDMLVRVAECLEQVGMTAYRMVSPNHLSGGQKQRVAIAGVLAMQPKCIIFDESTAMLDPRGRREVLRVAHELNRQKNITVLYITHEMDEVIYADRVCVLHKGELVLQDTPRNLFRRREELLSYGLAVPRITALAASLQERGIDIADAVLHIDDFISEMNRLMAYKAANTVIHSRKNSRISYDYNLDMDTEEIQKPSSNAMTNGLVLSHIFYDYSPDTAYSKLVLRDINIAIDKGEFIALIGQTGSGKSTLIQHLNGLLKPTEGQIYYEGQDIYEKSYDRSYLRSKVGLVFQYPEDQLFADTVLEDVCFGPKNLNLPLLEVQQRAFEAIRLVGLSDDVYDLSPFELSGGQKRRVAIAGILAMKPDILILDEPVAGLDPAGSKELLKILETLHREGMTIILVSHNMDDVAEYAERVVVLDQGSILYDESVETVFTHAGELRAVGLDIPSVTRLMLELKANGYDVPVNLYRQEDAVECLYDRLHHSDS